MTLISLIKMIIQGSKLINLSKKWSLGNKMINSDIRMIDPGRKSIILSCNLKKSLVMKKTNHRAEFQLEQKSLLVLQWLESAFFGGCS